MGADRQPTDREDFTPPPVVVSTDEMSIEPAETAPEVLRAGQPQTPDSGDRPGFFRRNLSALLLATAGMVGAAGGAASCNPDGSTDAANGGAEAAEQVEQKAQMLFLFTDETQQGFSLNLYNVDRAVNFEVFNQADGADVVKVTSTGGSLESVEGTFNSTADVGVWINAYDAKTGEQIAVGKPAPEGGIEWLNVQK